MEDDAFPLLDKIEFNKKLKETLNNIYILDKDWDIIQLHSDAIFPSPETYFTHGFVGSTAAYLISKKGAKKMATEIVRYHIDIQTSLNPNLIKYRSRQNLFWTQETTSFKSY